MPTLVHLVYIHGFQGNDTTFQSFPKDLQECLNANIPPHSDITIQSSLYPTYKSVKPISHATKNFLEWLSTQPPGPVILMGHSMGGLLAADAATDPSNISPNGRPKRIIGVMAFDTPFLGMHPHVVITGIASLLPKGGDDKAKSGESERAMNQHPQVQIVDPKVTDEWEEFKKQAHIRSMPPRSPYGSALSLPGTPSAGAGASASSSSAASRSPSPPLPFMDRAISFISTHSDKPLVRWLRKHADDPVASAKRWVIEHFQFGSCMFDPAGLKARYTRLVQWGADGGMWVNYWTHTVHRASEAGAATPVAHAGGEAARGDFSPLSAPGTPPAHSPPRSPSPMSGQKEKKAKRRHFIVLPNGLAQVLGGLELWELVPIAGVRDEVNAHTGIFIPDQNHEYEAFVKRVADRVLEWCRRLPQTDLRN